MECLVKMKGHEIIELLGTLLKGNEFIVGSNGNISRQVFHYLPKPQIYLRGSMGLPLAVGLGLAILLVFMLAFYVYFAMAWMTIARKLGYKYPWLAWIPFANIAMMLQLGGFHWAWVFLMLIPILGWLALGVLVIIATWKIFVKRKFPGWFSLSIIIPEVGGVLYLIAIGFVAWYKK